MNDPTWLEIALRTAAAGQLAIAVLGLVLHRLLDWRQPISQMPLLVREVFFVHTWFVALTCAIFGVLTWRFANALASGSLELGRWFCGALALFWGLRSTLQWTYYSASHWRGKPAPTVVHWVLFTSYAACAIAYAIAAGPHPPAS
jgi:hypothetical protein